MFTPFNCRTVSICLKTTGLCILFTVWILLRNRFFNKSRPSNCAWVLFLLMALFALAALFFLRRFSSFAAASLLFGFVGSRRFSDLEPSLTFFFSFLDFFGWLLVITTVVTGFDWLALICFSKSPPKDISTFFDISLRKFVSNHVVLRNCSWKAFSEIVQICYHVK